eukprot:gene20709-28411_t
MSSSSALSFTPPFTSSGRSALVQAPPWHYAGWLVNVAFEFDAGRAAALVPAALGTATGKGCVHFADWQSCGDDGRELLDPVYAQYRETIVVLEIAAGQGGGGITEILPAGEIRKARCKACGTSAVARAVDRASAGRPGAAHDLAGRVGFGDAGDG